MISKPRCECGRRATRFAVDRWPCRDGHYRTLALCPHCPSPEEIDHAARAIADSWSPAQMAARVYGCSLRQVDYYQRVDIAVVTFLDDE